MDDTYGDDLLMSLLMRFDLYDWWGGKLEDDGVPLKAYDLKHQLGDEFLALLLAILMERNNVRVGEFFCFKFNVCSTLTILEI